MPAGAGGLGESLTVGEGEQADGSRDPAAELSQALTAVTESPALPQLVILSGETGRGKTFAVQRFFDQLTTRYPGFWEPELTPRWPPRSRREVNRDRKRVQPRLPPAEPGTEPPFYWLAVGAAPAEGAVRTDMAASFHQQVHEQFMPTLAKAHRRKGIGAEAVKLALDALGVLLPPTGSERPPSSTPSRSRGSLEERVTSRPRGASPSRGRSRRSCVSAVGRHRSSSCSTTRRASARSCWNSCRD